MDGKTIWNQVGYGAKRYRDLSDDEKKAFLEYGITMGKLSTKDLTPKEWQLLKKSPDFALKGVREGYFKDEEPKEEAKSKKESLWTKALNKITQIAAGPQETGYSRIGPINIPETKPVTDISTSDMYKTQTSIPSLTDLLKRRQEEESYPSISFGIGPITIPQDVFETEKTRQTLPEITRPTIQPDQRFSTGILGGIGDIAHKKYASYQPESQNVSEPTNIIDRVVQGDNIAEKELKEKWNMSSEFAKKHPAISKALISFASPLRKVFDQPFMARAAQKGADIATMSTTPEKELPDTGNKYTNVLADLVGTVIGYSVPIAGMGESWMGTAHKAVTPITSRFGRFIENTAFKIKPENIKQAQRLLWVKDVLPVAIESGASLSALEGLRAIADPAYEELPIKEKAKAMESSFLWGALFGTVARTAEPYMKAAWLKARGYTEMKPGSGMWFKPGEGIIMEPTNFRNVKVRKEMFDQRIKNWYESKYGKGAQGITGETQTTQSEPQPGQSEQPTTAIAQIPQPKIIQNGTRYKLINMEELKRTGGAVQVKTSDGKTISTFPTVILNGQEIPSYKVHAMIQAGMKGIDYVLADPQPVKGINSLAEGFRQTDEKTWVNDETGEVIIDNSVQIPERFEEQPIPIPPEQFPEPQVVQPIQSQPIEQPTGEGFTKEELEEIKRAGEVAERENKALRERIGGLAVKTPKEARKEAEERVKHEIRIRKAIKDTDIEVTSAKEELKEEKAQRDNFVKLAKDKGFKAQIVNDIALRDIANIKNDLSKGRVTPDEVKAVLNYARENKLLPVEHIKVIEEGLKDYLLPKVKPEQPKAVKKEPWEMTNIEYVRWYDEAWKTEGVPGTEPDLLWASKNHKLIVEEALEQGKPVPEEVLKDYPDLAEKYKSKKETKQKEQQKSTKETKQPAKKKKESWEMTWEEYYNDKVIKQAAYTTKPSHKIWEEGKARHERIIRKALEQGKPVPDEVLKDYLELARKYTKQKKEKNETSSPFGKKSEVKPQEKPKPEPKEEPKAKATEEIKPEDVPFTELPYSGFKKGEFQITLTNGKDKKTVKGLIYKHLGIREDNSSSFTHIPTGAAINVIASNKTNLKRAVKFFADMTEHAPNDFEGFKKYIKEKNPQILSLANKIAASSYVGEQWKKIELSTLSTSEIETYKEYLNRPEIKKEINKKLTGKSGQKTKYVSPAQLINKRNLPLNIIDGDRYVGTPYWVIDKAFAPKGLINAYERLKKDGRRIETKAIEEIINKDKPYVRVIKADVIDGEDTVVLRNDKQGSMLGINEKIYKYFLRHGLNFGLRPSDKMIVLIAGDDMVAGVVAPKKITEEIKQKLELSTAKPETKEEVKPETKEEVKPETKEKEIWRFTEEEIKEIPVTEAGEKALQNQNPLLNDFIRWFKEKNNGFNGFKLSTYKDGEPVFLGNGIEVSLKDYLGEKEPTKQSKPIKISEQKSEKSGTIKEEKESVRKNQTPYTQIADEVVKVLSAGRKLTNQDLFEIADKYFGGTQAEGKYTSKDVYDAMELGVNKYILNTKGLSVGPLANVHSAINNLSNIEEFVLDNIPTQNRRTLETNELQQFSTPPNIAYTATWVANIYPNDVVLEPSAGVGGLAVFAKKAKADKVYVNEIAPRRIELLKELGFDKVFTENAEQLDNILPDEIKPTVILMNPPFSTAATRVKGKKNTQFIKAHIEQALKRLEPNGRLVAITGRGLAEGKPAFADWWKDIKKEYNVRANISIDGENYKKYGTQFDVQLIVIDKNGPTYGSVITDKVDTLEDAIKILEGIKRERTKLERERAKADRQDEQAVKTDREIKSSSAEHVGEEVSETSRGSARGDNTTPVSTNDVGAGTAGNETNVLPEQPTREIMAGSVDAGGRTGERNDASAVGNEPVSQIEDNAGIPDKTRAETGEKSGGRSGVSSTAVSGDRGINVKDTEKIEIQKTETKKKNDLEDSVYTPYEPQKLKIKDAKPHPGKLVQSAAMDAVLLPDPIYQPSLPKEVIEEGKLSIAQLEAVVYAGQAHEQILPDGKRKGFFIGDGTGVGKGREIAGIILDNMRQGRKKAVWISMNQDLYKDAIRDWTGIGGNREEIFNLSETSYDSPIQRESGIVYTTYATLINNSKDFIKSGEEKTESLKTRIGQLINWLGKDFDGVIAFDESHKIRNLGNKKGKFGKQKPAVTAETAELFRNSLPNARIVYVSATGATDVGDLGYLDRLGLWGRGTPFSSKNDFISKIEAGGLAAMELVARDMKAMGVYLARNLSYEGVEYSTVVHELTKEQQKVYDTLAEAWQVILQNLDKALEVTNMGENGRNRGKVYSSFWGAHQRFFNQVITSMQMPAVLKEAEKDLADGHAVVMHVDFTGEATQERLFSKITEEGIDIEEISITPLDIVMQYIDNCFPIYQYEVVEKDGKKSVELVKDSAGNPVINKTALRIKEDLMQRVGSLRIPSNPIDMVIEAFGPKNVAEITGRSRRIVKVIDEKTGQEKHVTEKRTDKVRELEADEFMDDKRRVLIFSRKGGTGRSYHADLTCKNQRLRMHYVVQPGFSAVNAVQGFGRTHRSNQKQPPHFKLFTTNIEGQKRFISSIARKLDQLGALTKGQRQTGGQGLFSAKDNLEDELARDALERFYRHLVRGDFPDIDKSVLKRMGLDRALLDEYGNIISSAPQLRETPNFLNRVLALTVEEQNKVFTRFKEIHDKMVEAAIERGELDFGLENYAADKVEVNEERLIRTDKLTGDTFYYNLTAYHKNDILKFEEIDRHIKNNKESFLGFYQNTRSKNIRAVFKTSKTKTLSNGDIIDVYVMHGQLPHQKGYIDEKTFDKANWQPIENKLDAEKLWNDAVDKTPQYRTETLHLISGSLLPVWDRLPSGHVRVVRVLTDDGRVILGRLIKQREIEYTLTKLGAEASKKDIDINDIPNKILQDDYVFVLSNGWRLIRKKVAGEYRIEISDAGASANLFDYREQLLEDGVFAEIVGGWKTRYFIPTEPQKAKEVIQKITEYRPVIEAIPPEPKGSLASKEYYDLGDAEETAEDRGTEVKVATDKVGKKLFRRDIVNYLKEKLDIPVRFRRYRKRALGLYKNKPEEIRLKYKEDLTTLAHEVGHHIDKIIELNKETTKELIQLARERGYKKQLRQEGVAIFIEKWFTDPEEAKLIAPRYFEIFESRLADYPEIEEILKTAQADIQDFLSMPVLDRVAASISFEPKDGVRKRPINFKQWFTSLWAAWFDELEPVKYFEEILAGDKKLSIKESPFYQLWLMRGATDLARTAIEGDGIKDADYNTVFPSLREILSPVKTEKEQRMYVYYDVTMRALELYDRGFNKRAIGIEATEAELKEVRNYLETNYPHFAEVRKKHLEWRDRINIQTLVDAGLLDKATAQKIRENNQEYAPFYRVMDEESINMFTGGIGSRGRLANLPKPIKRFTGSGGTIINTLDSDIKNAFTFLNMAQRNAVMNLIIDLAEKNEGMGKYVSKVDPGLKVTKLHLSELEKALTEAGIDTKDLDLEKLITIFRPSYWASAKDNTVVVFRKGKPQLYQLDPVLYRAVMMLDKPQTSNYVKLLRPFTNLKRMSAIITPAFIFYKNPFRDIVSAMMHEGPGIVTEIPRAVLSVVNKDEMYWKLKAAKGFQADLVSGDRDYMNKTVRNIMTKTFPEKIKNVLRHPFSTARDFLEFIDEIPRVAVGMKYVKIQTKKQKQTGKTQGEILEEAAVRMRDATLDFRRAGYISKEINQIKAFFNVNLQALDRARRAFIKDRFRFIARGLLLITLPTLILYMLNRDNKYYEELPEWRKDLFFNIPINGGKRFIWIPRADLYGLVFGALVERFLRAADKHDPHAFDDFAENVKKSTLPDVIPDALLPIYEVYSNYSMFLDRPIVPEGEQYKPKPQQYGFYTSQTARKLGEMFNASPRKINHLVSGYLARWGQWGLSASDKILETIGAVEKKTKTIEPFGPVEEPITSSSNSVNQFYNILEKARIAKKKEAKDRTPEEKELVRKLSRLNSYAKMLSHLRQRRKKVEEDNTLTPEEKTKKLRDINLKYINAARRALRKEPIKE